MHLDLLGTHFSTNYTFRDKSGYLPNYLTFESMPDVWTKNFIACGSSTASSSIVSNETSWVHAYMFEIDYMWKKNYL